MVNAIGAHLGLISQSWNNHIANTDVLALAVKALGRWEPRTWHLRLPARWRCCLRSIWRMTL
jgi:phage baseplate assembly protein W